MMKQGDALSILKTGAHVFVTGEPGSGKSYTINSYVEWLRKMGIPYAITASTGIAATHIGGFTLHAWSGIGVRDDLTAEDIDVITQKERVVQRVNEARVLIIDEVSMLSANAFTMADVICRTIRGEPRPFGGLQVVVVGDFFQLPPVVRSSRYKEESVDLWNETPKEGVFAFESPAWRALNPIVCYLDEQHRQADKPFLSLLAAMRSGEFGAPHRTLLRTRYSKEPQKEVPQLYTHNADVDRINAGQLAKLSGKPKTFQMTSKGASLLTDNLKKGCLSPETLILKVGARVMFTRNDMDGRYVNGTLGTVTGFADAGHPIVKTNAGTTVTVEPETWSLQDGSKVLASITQVPLRLAWAITVHKSQGMSLDAAHMDLSGAFEYGQGYVALSRVRSLKGLSIAGLNERATEVHPTIKEKDVEFRTKSEAAQKAFAKMPKNDLLKLHDAFASATASKKKGSLGEE